MASVTVCDVNALARTLDSRTRGGDTSSQQFHTKEESPCRFSPLHNPTQLAMEAHPDHTPATALPSASATEPPSLCASIIENVLGYAAEQPADLAASSQTCRRWYSISPRATQYLWNGVLRRKKNVYAPLGDVPSLVHDEFESYFSQEYPECTGPYNASMGFMKGQRLIVAGSAALHRRILQSNTRVHPRISHMARCWRPNDIDIWAVNVWNVSAESQCVARRIASNLELDYKLSSDEPYDLEVHDPHHPLRHRTLACDVRSLVFIYRGRKVGKINVIGTHPPTFSPYKLDPENVLRDFDFNCCQVGYFCRENPREEEPVFIYADQSDFETCLATGVAKQGDVWQSRVVTKATLDAGLRFLERWAKYYRRGFRLEYGKY